jgi:hypothetical protein
MPAPWFLYLFLLLAGGTALVGLLILTGCMKRYDATYSAASFVGSFVISASIMSSVHYHTFASLKGIINCILYPFGLLVLMVGVYQLVSDTTTAATTTPGTTGRHNDVSIDDANNGRDGIMVHPTTTTATTRPTRYGNGVGVDPNDDDDNEVRTVCLVCLWILDTPFHNHKVQAVYTLRASSTTTTML